MTMVTAIQHPLPPITAGRTAREPLKPAPSNTPEEARPDPGAVFDAIDLALDLNHNGPRDLAGAMKKLSAAECEEFLTMLAELLQQGVIGTETLDVNGEPYTCHLPARLGDSRLMHAKPWRGNTHRSLNVTA